MSDAIRIFAMPSNNGAIGYLRILEPCKMLVDKGLGVTTVFQNAQVTQEQIAEIIKNVDIVWFQAVLDQPYMWNLMNCRRFNPKIKLVMDVDDNLYTVNPWNPSYTAFTRDDDIKTDKINIALPKARNHSRIRLFEAQMMEADAVVTTTSLLASAYSHLNNNIFIMPNRLIWENWHFPHIPKLNDGKIRISWMGGSSHMMDWLECHAACKRIVDKYPQVVMQFQTSIECYHHFIKDFGQDRVEMHPWVDYSGHSFRMNCVKPDIAVIPLHEDEFSVCKSDLKLAEYSVLGVPSICSNIPPYSRSIKDGENGLLAPGDADFEKHLETLINDAELRESMGKKAYEWAEQNRKLETGVTEIKSMLDEIMTFPSWHIASEIKKEEKVPA